ncbi:uncharacterized protein LOC121384760 isoform X1 [Gigantopelta aegis]|uniref:uncharacterized protein LOC121384760 isoform X1 n=1 Tax=Gigantopelta aegis TaxID=1735272 RepID=UPI001B889B9B|nr:uncharacterized protein LOC121384760 isoform X1 [Gigantopelta aegis]
MAEANAHLLNCVEDERMEQTNVSTDQTTVNPLERLLQRQRSEIMNELRNIEEGERPVTGRDHRGNINSFFAKHLVDPAGSSGKENVPSNVDRVEEHRPESVVVEVQGLFEQHRVSSILQSASFRRQLESAIRGSITSASRQMSSASQASRRSRNGLRVASPAQPSTSQQVADEVGQSRLPQVPVAPPLESLAAAAATDSIPPHHSRASSHDSVVSVESANSASEDSNFDEVSPADIGVWRPVIESPAEPLTWENVSQIQREELVEEISELLHHRLVSSTLDGEFRGLLEIHMQNRLQSTEFDGENVANFVRSLPRNQPILHNDFSHLGLQGPTDNLDNISVTSLSATAVPYTHSNLYLSREIKSLKAQMVEMKNMIKLNFDLSLDIQRAVRQEVAAGIAMAAGENAAAAATAPASARSMPVNDTHCVVCLENFSDSVLYQCGHMCVCYACGKHLLSLGSKCPMCRAPIKDIIRAYKCANE